MKATDELFQLIRSLNKTEKGYFKKYSQLHSRGEETGYIRLFEAIDVMKEYDEDILREKLKGEKFLEYLPTAKNYLYNFILKSLRNYHSDTGIDSILHDSLREAEIIFKKGLYDQYAKLVRKARALAQKYEKDLFILEAVAMENRALTTISTPDEYQRYAIELNQLLFDSIDRHKNLVEYRAWINQIFSILRSKGESFRSREELEEMKNLEALQLALHEDNARSFRARCLYYNGRAAIKKYCGQPLESIMFNKRQIEYMEANPELMQDNFDSYLSAINNLMVSAMAAGNMELTREAIDKFRAITNSSTDVQARIFERTNPVEVIWYLQTGKIDEGLEKVAAIEEGLEKFKGKISKAFLFPLYDNLSNLYFFSGNFSKALFWRNMILNDPNIRLREDIQNYSRIINLIIHYELGNQDTMEYLLRSTYRYLLKRERLYKFETLILKFLKDSPSYNTRKEITEAFTRLQKELKLLESDAYEKNALEYFDMITWLESRISDLPIKEVTIRKALNAVSS